MTAAARERLRIFAPLLIGSGAGWFLLTISEHRMAINPAGTMRAMTVLPQPEIGWLARPEFSALPLMLVAMMLPLLSAPLQHVHARSLAHRRGRSILLFLVGYFAVWAIVGTILAELALQVRLAGAESGFLGVLVGAILWQCSPVKQRFLNRCHHRPDLAAFGQEADRGAIRFGVTHGAWCACSCWLLMLLPMVSSGSHLTAMLGAGGWMIAERLERPRPLQWQLRWPAKAGRILLGACCGPTFIAGRN